MWGDVDSYIAPISVSLSQLHELVSAGVLGSVASRALPDTQISCTHIQATTCGYSDSYYIFIKSLVLYTSYSN